MKVLCNAVLILALSGLASPALADVSLIDVNTAGRSDLGFARLGDDSALLQDRYLIFSGSDQSFSGVYGREPWVHDLETGQTRLLADINPGSADASPSDFTALENVVVFVALDPEHGRELWATDGSPAGTVRIADTRPGPDNGSIADLTAVLPNRLVFAVDDGVNGREPWTSDGTPAGTRLLADINPGPAASSPSGFVWLNGQLLFAASDGSSGLELWRWTLAQGAEQVLDIRPGALSSSPFGLRRVATSFGTFVLFSATTDGDGSQAWVSDGTPSGTQQLFAIGSGAAPEDFVWHEGLDRLFFSADDGMVGRELWQFHPSVGPSLVEDLRPGPDGSQPRHLAQVDGELAFIARDADNRPRLYAYDGTMIDSIVLLSTFSQEVFSPVVWSDQWFARGQFNCHRWSPLGGHHTFMCQSSPDLAVLPDGVIHGSGSTLNDEIWILDASGQATQLTDFTSFSSSPSEFLWVGDEVFFSANDGISGFELWVSDASEAGTRGFDLAPGLLDASPTAFAEFSNRVWFVARDGDGQRRL
jgi:ELWxxDGT repeat protein